MALQAASFLPPAITAHKEGKANGGLKDSAFLGVHLSENRMKSSFGSPLLSHGKGLNASTIIKAQATATASPAINKASPEAKKTLRKGNAVITGASSGLGLATAKALAETGKWNVVMACRDFLKAEKAAKSAGMAKENYSIMHLDLASLDSVRQFVSNFRRSGMPLDVLVCNAAVYFPTAGEPTYTADGFEMSVGVNHIGHFLLAHELLEDMKQSDYPSRRLIIVGSITALLSFFFYGISESKTLTILLLRLRSNPKERTESSADRAHPSRHNRAFNIPPPFTAHLLRPASAMAEIEASKPAENGKTTAAAALSPLSETLWREKTNTELLGDISARLTWKDLTVTVALGNGETHSVLEGITGSAEPGSLTAIMGPSGSGKSTLLDALSSRLAPNAILSGAILLNGRKAKLSFGTAAYVTQDDNLIGTLTVRETIMYSARLRLPEEMGREEKRAVVEGAVVEMGLQDCADTVIGNWHRRGISGGEKRRVSIAIEILMRPRLLFLDEPTSGLDSASAFFVTQTLRDLSRGGRTVIGSIHQPSSEVFELFDQLYLLSGGRTVYFGKASEACEFFAEAGFPCPAMRNPSDHFLRCTNSDFDKVKATLEGSMKTRPERSTDDPLEKITTAEATRRLIEFYRHSQYSHTARLKVDQISRVKGTILDFGGSQTSFFMQSYILTKRSFVNMSRDLGYYWMRLLIYLLVTFCIGTIYFNVGTNYNSILARGACSSFVFGFVTFMSIGGFPSFVEDMKVFQRERLNGHYGVAAFVIGNTLSGMPFLILITFLSGTICYFMVRLHAGFSHYVFFVLCLYSSVTVVESLMMAIASVVPNFLMGIIIGAGIQGIFMLVSGYFRLPNDIPKPFWRYPMSYISFHYWALQGQYQNDLKGLLFDGQRPYGLKIPGEYVLEHIFQIDVRRSKWSDLAVIFGMIIAYRLIFFAMIKVSESLTPWIRGYIARRRFYKKQSVKASADLTERTPSLRAYVARPAAAGSSGVV